MARVRTVLPHSKLQGVARQQVQYMYHLATFAPYCTTDLVDGY